MTEDETMQWKRDNPNYAATEPCGKYFLMRIVEFKLENPPDSDQELAKVAIKFLLKGGDIWHDHYIMTGNWMGNGFLLMNLSFQRLQLLTLMKYFVMSEQKNK